MASRCPGRSACGLRKLLAAVSEPSDTRCDLAIDDSVSPRFTTCGCAAAWVSGASTSAVVMTMPAVIGTRLTLASVVSGLLAEELKMPLEPTGSTKRESIMPHAVTAIDAARTLTAYSPGLLIPPSRVERWMRKEINRGGTKRSGIGYAPYAFLDRKTVLL